jgi:tRNA-dihydrouridine synthase B
MNIDLHEHWTLGGVDIPGRLVLAPMAGVSVQAFRRQGRRYGAGLVCSEMVSVAGIQHRNERTLGYLRVASDEHPLAIRSRLRSRRHGGGRPDGQASGADIVDFGCPVKKVTKTGAGASLLDD